MQIGMIGLGRMGSNMVRRLHSHGQQCVVYDANAQAVQALAPFAAGASLTSVIVIFTVEVLES